MKKMRQLIALFLFAFILSMGNMAVAGGLNDCTSGNDCDCSGYAGDGYTDCESFSTLLDTSDPDAVRSALNITHTTDSNGDLDKVSVTLRSAQSKILPVNHAGWDDAADLNEFLNEMILDDPYPSNGINICDPNTWFNTYSQVGGMARYDEQTSDWADTQFQNALFSVLADEDGGIYVDGIRLYEVGPADKDCLTKSDGSLSAEGCSYLIEVPEKLEPGDVERVCEENYPEPDQTIMKAENSVEVTAPEWTDYFADPSTNTDFVVKYYHVDYLMTYGTYYNSSAFLEENGWSTRTEAEGQDLVIHNHDAAGTCGYGEAEDAAYDVKFAGDTNAGVVPLVSGQPNCPTDPSE